MLSPEETVQLEPALRGIESTLVGSIYTPDDETADCYKFCLALYKALERVTTSDVYMHMK